MTASGYDRREFLRRAGMLSAAVAGGSLAARRPAVAQADPALAPFLHGVASGDPLHDRVILWTRVTPPDGHGSAPIAVSWRIATDPQLRDVVARGAVQARPDDDWTVKVDPTGLQPFTTYYYAFAARGRTSIVGRTRTAPAPGADVGRLRFGVVSCSNYEGGFFNAYARLAERHDLDAILALGDYVYEYGQGGYGPGEQIGRVTQPPEEMVTLAQYRGRYAHYRLDPDLRRLHQLFPFVNTWDDHETTNDSWRDGAQNHDEGEGDYAVRKANAQRAWQEWLPTRVEDPSRIYRTLRYGALADLLWMDTRIEGRDEIVGGVLDPMNPTYTQLDDPARQMISDEQRAWLFADLERSAADGVAWRLLCQQVMMMQWDAGGVPTGLGGNDFPDLLPVTEGGSKVNPDAWDGYPAERARIFAHLRDRDIRDVVVLTGDIHSSWAADLTEDPKDPLGYDPTGANPAVPRNLGVEFVTPSITSDNIDEIVMSEGGTREAGIAAARTIEAGTMADNPHIRMVELEHHGYLVLDVTAERVQSDWFFVDTILEPSDVESHFDSWYVERDEHRVLRADAPLAPREGAPPAPDQTPAPPPPGDGPDGAPAPTPNPGGDGPAALPATGGGFVLGGLAALAGAAVLRRRSSPPGPDAG